MVKNIVGAISDQRIMEKGLVLNKSYDIFYLGEDVSKYEKMAHAKTHFDNPFGFDCYEIEIHGYNITLQSEEGHVDNISCSESCIYNGQELIMMKFDDFVKIIKEEPADHDICYLPGSNQNQHVFEFYKAGLQVWVWRGRIRTIIIDTYEDEE